jgi:primary-amine oxidase
MWKVLDANTYEVLAIDVPARRDQDGTLLAPSTAPPSFTGTGTDTTELRHPPRERAEFLPELMKEHHGIKERSDLKPLIISQPEGVSFSMNGNELEWQKWKMHIGFHYREVSALLAIRTIRG